MKEKLTFKKGIYTINFPFMITNFSPWQQQVAVELDKMRGKYLVRKSARWGFNITENGGEIKCYKS